MCACVGWTKGGGGGGGAEEKAKKKKKKASVVYRSVDNRLKSIREVHVY